jgi:hypothetical protein
MKNYFGGKLRRIYEPSKKFFIKSPYPYLSKCTDPLKGVVEAIWTFLNCASRINEEQ